MRVLIAALIGFVSLGALAQGRSVFGTVTDSTGAPIADVEILLVPAQSQIDVKKGKTDEKGRYTLRDFLPGNITMTFSKEGYLPRTIPWATTDETNRDRHDAVLYKEGEDVAAPDTLVPISGKVYNRKGEPLAGVKVVARVDGTPFMKETTTDTTGAYTVQGMKNNMVSLQGSLVEHRDQIVKVRVGIEPVVMDDPTTFVMATLDEAYAELGQERPDKKKLTPEEEAIEIFNLAVDAYQTGNFANAEEAGVKAHTLNPNMIEAIKLLVTVNHKQKDWKDVLTYSNKYLKLKPDDTNIMAAADEAARMTNDKAAAADIKNQLKAAGKITAETMWNEATNAINANDDEALMKVLKEIQTSFPKETRVTFEMGKIKIREGELDEALKMLKSYIKIAKPDEQEYVKEAKELILTLSE